MSEIKPPIIINLSGSMGNSAATISSAVGVKDAFFGAVGNGIADDYTAIQAAVDYCITHAINSLFIPKGTYNISAPIVVASNYNGSYSGFGIRIFGEGNMWDSKTIIRATFSDRFILGIQKAKGVIIQGIHFIGNFTVPNVSTKQFFNLTFEQFTDGICRDSINSPYAAIVIDPFSNGQLPTDGGYPSMSAYYVGNGNVGGSTSVQILDCITEKTVVGICSSPNSFTRNAELTTIQNVQFKNHKVCISGGHDQEKANYVRNIACWYDSHTIFATGVYGTEKSGNWNIDNVNIAGKVVRFIYSNQQNYFPLTIKNVYAESLGTWGYMNCGGAITSRVEDCKIGFAYPSEAGMQPIYIDGHNTVYDNCFFRFYGANYPIPIAGASTFNNCAFGGFPVFSGKYFYPRFKDCRAMDTILGLTGSKTASPDNIFVYGDWTIYDYSSVYDIHTGNTDGFHRTVTSKSQDIYTTFRPDNVTVTINGDIATFVAADATAYFLNALVDIGYCLGIITNITGNTITVSYLNGPLTTGIYVVTVFYPVLFKGMFMGDITSGSNQILNCKGNQFWGGLNLSGYVIKNPYGGSKYIKITTVFGTAITFYGSITTTKTGAVFGNYTSQEIYTDYPTNNAFPAGHIVRKGDEITEMKGSENQVKHKITVGGFLSGDSDLRQATLQTI